MRKAGSIQIKGEEIRKLRLRLALTQEELARALNMSAAGIRRIESQDVTGVYPRVLRSLSEFTKEPIAKLLLDLSARAQSESDEIDPMDIRPVPEIPTFELAVAAGPWADVCEIAELHSPRQIADGRFRIRIKGDSMTPKFPSGTLVEFRHIPCGVELEIGKNYYVQVDSMATFKHLEKSDIETLTLRALNKRKYPEPMIVQCRDVVRMAKAIAIVVPQD
jgi:transcriptional regulator with XRE-family HTH domain